MTDTFQAPAFETLIEVRNHTSAVLGSLIDGHESVALFDIPTHENVGDNMIWEGELSYLRILNKRVTYETDVFRHSDSVFNKLAPRVPILLHGGGNFGDIWPIFQDFRESIVRSYPDRRIIQLPQTVYFESSARATAANAVLSSHPDFTLLVRDMDSFERAQQSLPDVRVAFCPDMALGWQPATQVTANEKRSVLVLAREDKEAADDLGGALRERLRGDCEVRDWRLTGSQKLLWFATRIPGRLVRIFPRLRDSVSAFRIVRAANRFNRGQNLKAGLRMMNQRKAIVTNRLHAHVLAGLLDLPHAVTENSYGKIGPIFRDYTHVLTSGSFYQSVEEVANSPLVHASE